MDIENKSEVWKKVSTIGVVLNTKGEEVDFTPFDNYWVSNMGRVYNDITKRFLPQEGKGIDKDGYILIGLGNSNKHNVKTRKGRLVALAFLPNPNNYPQINYKNEIKTDDRLVNLEWCDAKYNNSYGTRIERISKKVYQYTKDGKLVKVWKSISDAGLNGFDITCISDCCRGKHKTHKGFVWCFNLL